LLALELFVRFWRQPEP